MHPPLHFDPAIRTVPWHDLVPVSRREVVAELALSAPWLAAAWVLAYEGSLIPAFACSFLFFLTALRQVHNAFHGALGIPCRATEWVIFALSVLMLGSNHVVKFQHLRHHRFCLEADDLEADSARGSGLRVLLCGPLYPLRLYAHALRTADAPTRRWIVAELAASVIWVCVVFGVLEVSVLRYHVAAMAIGQWLAPFFCVWTVHHHCDRAGMFARTERRRWLNLVTYNMFLHLEHHLFPAVPTRHLGPLAARLDAARPDVPWTPVL